MVHATQSAQTRVFRALGTGGDKTSIRGLAQRDPSRFRALGNKNATLANQCRPDRRPCGFDRLVCGSRLEYLAPFWWVILADYGLVIATHLGLVLAALAASLYGVTRRDVEGDWD